MMLKPLQLPSVDQNPSCGGYAHDAEENKMWRELVRKKRSQGKTERD